MENELISVIIPIYNSEKYLERCLRSVLDSTYRNLEIICVDDGSTDGSAAILERLAQLDSRIRVITDINGGLSVARNRGMNAVTGDYISFIDSDDQIHPRMLELLYSGIAVHGCGLATCDYARPTEIHSAGAFPAVNENHYDILRAEQLYSIKNQKGYVWGKLYAARMIDKIRFVEKRGILEDVLFNAEIISKDLNLKVCYLKDPMYFYYDTPGSLVHRISNAGLLSTAESYAQIVARINDARAKRIVLREEIKILLSLRKNMQKSSDRAGLNGCKSTLKSAVDEFTKLSCVSKKEKLMYNTMLHVPVTYSLGTWLVMQKNKRR